MSLRSIRVRLTAWYAVILVATFAIEGGGAWLAMRDSIHESVDESLAEQFSRLQTEVVAVASGGAEAVSERIRSQPVTGPETRFRISNGTRWIYQSPGAAVWGASPVAVSPRLDGGAQTLVVKGRPFRMLVSRVPIGGANWRIELGVPIGDFYRALDRVAWTIVLASPLALLIASAGGYWMSKRALEPVDRITRTARAIGSNNLTARLPLRGTGDELDRLSETLNAMFARLDAAFQRVTQFTADASHELRTPTAIIRTTAELARRRSRTEAEYIDALDGILAESERTSRLIDDLLLLARTDADSEEFTFESTDLAQSLREACDQGRVLAQAAHLAFADAIDAECPVRGDSQALRRLFLILLDNAIKFTGPGGTVGVKMDVSPAAATIEVSDTGIGIAAADLPHLFERFYRVGNDRSRARGGAGLGLAIAERIASAHGGRISVRSAPGTGTTVHVRLPRTS